MFESATATRARLAALATRPSTPLAAIVPPSTHRLDRVEVDGHVFENDVIDGPDCEIYGLTADLVLDLLAWLDGRERDRVPARLADLELAKHWLR